MNISKLTRSEIEDLRLSLVEQPLHNYELLWVLDACLESPGSMVAGVGRYPWPAGLMIRHRECFWLRLANEMFMEDLLGCFPRQDVYRVYTTDHQSLDMLKRWLPGGESRQSSLCVRNATKSWRRRFSVSPELAGGENADDPGTEYRLYTTSRQVIASVTVRSLVEPFQEITHWEIYADSQYSYWLEEVFGAMVNHFLSQKLPVVARLGEDSLVQLLEPLGFREFSPLYFYIGLAE